MPDLDGLPVFLVLVGMFTVAAVARWAAERRRKRRETPQPPDPPR
jgi:uncharacterized membrane protein YidH (DUF202 family)